MYISNITDDYNDFKDTLSSNCTNNENNIEIIILVFTILPCGMSLLCIISLMVYTLIKHLKKNKTIFSKKNGENFILKLSSPLHNNRA